MKRLSVIFLILILYLTLTACENTGLGIVSSTPGAETPISPPMQIVFSTEPPHASNLLDEYISVASIAVEDNKTLTLKLKGRKSSEEYHTYGIGEILVYDGENLIQTLRIADAIIAHWGDDAGFDGYTCWWEEDGGLSTTDMNFDGSEDIGLVGWITAGANIPSYYWLWDAEDEQFQYAFCLCNLEVDEENHQLISRTSGGIILEQTGYYEYDTDGNLQEVKQVVTEVDYSDERPIVTTKVYELIDGVLQIVS